MIVQEPIDREMECPSCHHEFKTPFWGRLRCPECGYQWTEAL